MDIGSFLLLLALIIVVAAFVASPLRVRRGAEGLSQRDHEVSELLAERERVLEFLEELDLDHAMGKVPEDLYGAQREILLRRGADVLRLLDERQVDSSKLVQAEDDDDSLEALIAARKAGSQPAPEAAAKTSAGGKFCPSCGSKLEAGDRFCANCGAKL